MGFMQWIYGLLGKQPQPGFSASSRRTLASLQTEPDEIEGLNFRKAVQAHQVWKNRLGDYITGKNPDLLNASEISNADQCVLGLWMKRYGNQRYGQEKMYVELRRAHTQLHLQASRVVVEYHNGNAALAQELLLQGEYPLSAMRLVSLLARLYQRCQDGFI
jgi:hypothetical protein